MEPLAPDKAFSGRIYLETDSGSRDLIGEVSTHAAVEEIKRISSAEAEEKEARSKDCKVCGEPEHSPCFVDVHEKAARSDERRSIAQWVREHAREERYHYSDDEGGGLDPDRFADAIEGRGA
jgi:hypothetical protein